ncbi:MAG: DUF1080 domain-containing protein [Bacteroidaceae bacterium]|nr:DUF1080 domain-containing protein [Bacteroidaceae bacterium]
MYKLFSALVALTLSLSVHAQSTSDTQGPSQQGANTPENQLIALRHQLEETADAAGQKKILRAMAETGTFVAMTTIAQQLDDPELQKTAARGVASIALAHPEYDGYLTRYLLAKSLPHVGGSQKKSIIARLGEPPVEGFVSHFNGKDLSGWKGLVQNPVAREQMTPLQLAEQQVAADQRMHADWKVEDGMLVYVGTGFDNICTEEQFGDFEMLVDWRLDPSGTEPDAGIYLRGTPQVQIWDIARTNVGAQVGSGGLYNNQQHRSIPLCVADNPLGEWNTFYIRMEGDRVTVHLNGVIVVDNVPLENYWDRHRPIFPVEQIELQAHGSKVYYRDIYIRRL